jgi:hypothetical protein
MNGASFWLDMWMIPWRFVRWCSRFYICVCVLRYLHGRRRLCVQVFICLHCCLDSTRRHYYAPVVGSLDLDFDLDADLDVDWWPSTRIHFYTEESVNNMLLTVRMTTKNLDRGGIAMAATTRLLPSFLPSFPTTTNHNENDESKFEHFETWNVSNPENDPVGVWKTVNRNNRIYVWYR